jgi:acetyl esterase
MPLDPQARALLDQLAARGDPPVTALTPQEARAQMVQATARLGEPPAIARVEALTVPGPGGAIPVRILAPQGKAPLPALVYFHGGGWVVGSIDTHDALCRALANAAGVTVVSVDYRLAPEHKFPAAAEDAYAATAWVAAHAAEIGVDPARLAVGGDSAGGNLATVVALMARERGGPRLVYQILIYPITDFNLETASYRENADGYFLTREAMAWYWGHYLANEADGQHPYASPLRASDLRGLPPALVITAEFDPLCDEGEAYAARLAAAGVPVTLTRYDGMIHGFLRRPVQLDRARGALVEAAAALERAFGRAVGYA